MFKDNTARICPVSERRFDMIPVDKINVPNPRKRDEKQFQEHLRSIREIGLRKPITVNSHNYNQTGKYDLVCGQGRWEIHQKLEKTHIMAEIIDVDDGTAYILSLVENIARGRPASIEFAKAIVEMYDSGMTLEELTKITGRSRNDLLDYIQLMKKGEIRLIQGVEDGIYSITFAKDIARSDDAAAQKLMMDAFDEGMITSANLKMVRKIINLRKSEPYARPYENIEDLKNSIREMTEKKKTECGQAKRKESRLYRLLIALREMKSSPEFVELMKECGVSMMLNLKGSYPDLQ